MTLLSSKEKGVAEAPPFCLLILFENGSGNHILYLAAIMIIFVVLGLVGPQAASSMDRRDALHQRDKEKGRTRRCSLYGSDFIRF
jgi:hypothetical protein